MWFCFKPLQYKLWSKIKASGKSKEILNLVENNSEVFTSS